MRLKSIFKLLRLIKNAKLFIQKLFHPNKVRHGRDAKSTDFDVSVMFI